MKILISDLDGTFMTSEEETRENVKAVNKFMEDNIFIIATGRAYTNFKEKEEEYNIKYDYLILDHGAIIMKDNEILQEAYIDDKEKNKMLQELQEFKYTSFASRLKERVLDLNEKNLNKIAFDFGNEKMAKKAFEIIKKYNFQSYHIYKKYVEIINPNVNKSNAIQHIIEHSNLTRENIYTIGDGTNDINMIQDFNGYRMTKSAPEVMKQINNSVDSVNILINKLMSEKYLDIVK